MKGLPVLLWLCTAVCSSYPLHGSEEDAGMEVLQKYLENYYGLEKDVKQFTKKKDSSPVVKKIQEMQKFLGLKMTGKLDSNTMELMHKPRCGVPDVGGFSTFPGSPKWRKNHISYRIVNYTLDLPRESVDSAIERALKVWEEVTPLTFSRISEGEADIMISFAVEEHGDFIPFDGPGMVLAHAYAPGPGINGDAHFDDDERWTDDVTGTNLFLVAAHELGHSLGLFHSANAEALMYPVYKSSTDLARFHLSQDDVDGIQSLYGPPTESPDVLVVPTKSNSLDPETLPMCSSALSFDAVSTLRGEVLFFKDRHFWRKSVRTPEPGFYLISSFWPSLPSNMDAAYEVTNRDTVFILKGNQIWAIRGHEELAGYPKSIHTLGLPETVQKIDAAISLKDQKKTYFFVEDKFWRFDEKKQSMDPEFPRKIAENFPGIGTKVDAVFEAFGFLYFFSGSSQLEFDPNAGKVTHILKSNSWFNC